MKKRTAEQHVYGTLSEISENYSQTKQKRDRRSTFFTSSDQNRSSESSLASSWITFWETLVVDWCDLLRLLDRELQKLCLMCWRVSLPKCRGKPQALISSPSSSNSSPRTSCFTSWMSNRLLLLLDPDAQDPRRAFETSLELFWSLH